MKRRIFILLTLILAAAASTFAQTAAQLLEQTAKEFRSAKSISARYTLTTPGGSTSGNVTFAGDKFRMTSPELLTWYDGTTQWSYLTADGEVTVSEPTAEELQQINPFIIINTFRSAYTPALLKSDKQGFKNLQLTAKDPKASIKRAVVTISTSTKLPSRIVLTTASNQTATITISNPSRGKALPTSTFKFPSSQYPGVEVIDLR